MLELMLRRLLPWVPEGHEYGLHLGKRFGCGFHSKTVDLLANPPGGLLLDVARRHAFASREPDDEYRVVFFFGRFETPFWSWKPRRPHGFALTWEPRREGLRWQRW